MIESSNGFGAHARDCNIEVMGSNSGLSFYWLRFVSRVSVKSDLKEKMLIRKKKKQKYAVGESQEQCNSNQFFYCNPQSNEIFSST